ncbi:uncharacterized protein LOC126695728 [Quercus robur]|uniref:uncharacterized protein LOC126695728 n=1 Tax=Quercus robur TaxID=38942 RepID=UPI002163344B|nr:uncharacterized protein LOC126695728 [Quercus robur]
MDMLIDSAAGHAMFSFMDGFSGYNQIRMSPKDVAKTAFRTPIGNFYYTIMPFGLKNAGTTYQRAMTTIFHDMMHKEIEDYVDDIVVKSKVRENHFCDLRRVFERCCLYKLCMNPSNVLLVHSRSGRSHHYLYPLAEEGKALSLESEMLASLLLIAATYDQAANRQSIADLLAWFPGEEGWDVADEVPEDLPEVSTVEATKTRWILRFDGSSTAAEGGAGIVLIKETGEAVAMFDNRFADALATLGARISFEGTATEVTIIKKPVPAIQVLKKEFFEQPLDQADWRSPVKEFLLSPSSKEQLKCFKDYTLVAGELYRKFLGGVLARYLSLSESRKRLREVHEKSYGSSEGILLDNRDEAYRLKRMVTCYFVEGGVLFQKGFNGEPLRCLGTLEAQAFMQEVHAGECGDHQGKKRLLQLLLNLGYFWPTMKQDTAKHVKTLVTEYFTKWVEAIPLKKAIGPAVANFIHEHIICRFGIPHKIVSDNGTRFVNKDVHKLLDHRHIKHRKSTPYYPQGNGHAEATNRVLLRILSKMVHKYEGGWSEHLLETLWAYRSSAKTATGFSPFSLVYGTEAISQVELLVPTPRVVHSQEIEMSAATCAECKVSNLETLEEARNLALSRIQRY